MAGISLTVEQSAALDAVLQRLAAAAVDPPEPAATAAVGELVECIAAKPWRRSSLDTQSRDDLVGKVEAALATGQPIEFAVPFAGCKSWRVAGFPEPGWAEMFWIDYLRRFAERISRLHAPGVVISFSHASGAVDWMNDLPAGSQARYMARFEEMLTVRSSPRTRLRTEDHAASCGGGEALVRLLESSLSEATTPGPTELASARRNLYFDARGRDQAVPGEREVELAARRCAALMSFPPRRAFNKDGGRIQISHLRGASRALHLGSTRTSVAQPWASTGYLEWHESRRCWLECLATSSRDASQFRLVPVEHPLARRLPTLATLAVKVTSPELGS